MKTLYNKYDKNKINALPQVLFPGKIFVVQSESEADKAVDYLLSCDIMGVDTETKPSFKRGQMHKVALLQVSTRDICFLFRLNFIGMPQSVIRLLSNTTVPMIGLSWHDDICSLHRRQDFEPGLFIDIQNIVGKLGIEDLSLQKLYANIFGEKISKRQRLTNWEADVLNEKQKRYAATDAWACINLYHEILRLEAEHDYSLIKVPEPEPKLAVAAQSSNEENITAEDVQTVGHAAVVAETAVADSGLERKAVRRKTTSAKAKSETTGKNTAKQTAGTGTAAKGRSRKKTPEKQQEDVSVDSSNI